VKIADRVPIIDSAGNFTGRIPTAGCYRPAIYTCNQDFAKFEVIVLFRNPNSLLSADVFPCLFLKPAAIAIFSILFVSWLFNWVQNFTLINHLHSLLTITFSVNLLRAVFSELELLHMDHDDSYTPLSGIVVAFQILFDLSMMTTLLMAGRGWRIVYEAISCKEIMSACLFSAGVLLPLTGITFTTDPLLLRIFLLATVLFIVAYCWRMISGVNNASSLVLGHLLVISRSGIDPRTTPVYSKFKIFRVMVLSIVVYFLSMAFRLIVKEIVFLPFWGLDLADTTATIMIIGAVSWAFRLAPGRRSGYLMIDSCDEQRGEELLRCEIDRLDLESSELREGQAIWENGMTLPNQPILLDGARPKISDMGAELL
jgi:hypothetical protein